MNLIFFYISIIITIIGISFFLKFLYDRYRPWFTTYKDYIHVINSSDLNNPDLISYNLMNRTIDEEYKYTKIRVKYYGHISLISLLPFIITICIYFNKGSFELDFSNYKLSSFFIIFGFLGLFISIAMGLLFLGNYLNMAIVKKVAQNHDRLLDD